MLSGIVTAVLLVLFVGGTVWAFSPKRKGDFDAAAQLPLDDDAPRAGEANRKNEEEASR